MTQPLIYGPTLQASGAFDGGKITEQKPIGFPGEGSVIKRVGPLFYWAWAQSKEEGYLPLHPHQAFEIMTYVVQGKAQHGDTLGTKSTIGAGGAQVMQTGSGVSHEERFIGPDMEGFQIWFEPSMKEALKRQPTYSQFEHEQFPSEQGDGYVSKTVLGAGSPVELVAEAQMWDVIIEPGKAFRRSIAEGNTLTALAIRGSGTIGYASGDRAAARFNHKDFIVQQADAELEVILTAGGEETLRIILIEVPSSVSYPLLRKR
ncbi:pirin family protein [Paenibacillus mendelii]|uniref:Pirin family protein n=1 Tax=Paenibacillus mendelii TaxID=206163 RepID=A0ABV6J2X2_9BACL|nr:pirin family protein [Paenibacillus mendelii]MCQ6559321.1 pirin family protein [Paenibacillus mendelii]